MTTTTHFDAKRHLTGWGRWIVRCASLLIVILAIAYVSLPWWLPTGWIRNVLKQELSESLGRDVQIGAVHVSWAEGITIEDIEVPSASASEFEFLARVGGIACDFTPLRTAITGRVRQLRLYQPQLWLGLDEEGQLDLSHLQGRKKGGIPSLDYLLRDVELHVATPHVSQTFRVDTLRWQLEPETGTMRVAAVATVDSTASAESSAVTGRLTIDSNVRIPRLKRNVQLEGDVRVEWADLSLKDLPVPLISQLPVEQVAGVSNGELAFTAHPNLGIDYELDLLFNGVRLVRHGFTSAATIPDARITCQGHLDPNVDRLEMYAFDYRTPSVELSGEGDAADPALVLEVTGPPLFSASMNGRVHDWAGLESEVPQLEDLLARAELLLDGSSRIDLEVSQTGAAQRLFLDVDAGDSVVLFQPRGKPWLTAEAGMRKSFSVEFEHDPTAGIWDIPFVEVQLPGGRFSGSATLPQSAARLAGLLIDPRQSPDANATIQPSEGQFFDKSKGTSLQGTAYVEEPDALLRALPGLRSHLVPVSANGPMQVRMLVGNQAGRLDVDLSGRLSRESSIEWPEVFSKRPGNTMRVDARLSWPHSTAGQLENVELKLRHGDSMMELASADTRFTYELVADSAEYPHRRTQPNRSVELKIDTPIRFRNVESMTELFPAWQELLSGRPGPSISGDLVGSLTGRYQWTPSEHLWDSRLQLNGDALRANVGDWLHKEVGQPFQLDARFRDEAVDGQRDRYLHADLRLPKTTVEMDFVVAGDSSGGYRTRVQEETEQVAVKVQTEDAGVLRRLSPRLFSEFDIVEVSGPLSIDLAGANIGDWQSATLDIDATDAVVLVRGEAPFEKPVDVPGTASVRWKSGPNLTDPTRREWILDNATAHIADLRVDRLGGTIEVSHDRGGRRGLASATGHHAGEEGSWLPGPVTFEQAKLHGDFRLMASPRTRDLHPAFKHLLEERELEGALEGAFDIRADRRHLGIDLHCDTHALRGTFDLDNEILSTLRKTGDTPFAIEASIGLSPWQPSHKREVALSRVAMSFGQNRLEAEGVVQLAMSPEGAWRVMDASGTGLFKLNAADEVSEALPEALVRAEGGTGEASFDVRYTPGGFDVRNGRLGFEDLQLAIGSQTVTIGGEIEIGPNRADLRDVAFQWGPSDGSVSGYADWGESPSTATFAVQSARIEQRDLERRVAEVADTLGHIFEGPRLSGREVIDILLHQAGEWSIVLDGNADSFLASLPGGVRAEADAVQQQLRVKDGKAKLKFDCLLDGGVVTGTIDTHLTVDDPRFHLAYRAERIQPGDVVDSYLESRFVGMKATGPLTLIDETYQKLLAVPNEPNPDVGKGEMMIEGGEVSGKAAPDWMIRIFPGLNLARYEFDYMHCWFEKLPSLRHTHQMIFQGRFYNLYMIGYSEPADDAEQNEEGNLIRFRYEVGIDFLADFDSKYWADTGQGRVPLFVKHGLLDSRTGELLEDRVTYEPASRILDTLLVKNNLVVTAYYAVRRQVEGKQEDN